MKSSGPEIPIRNRHCRVSWLLVVPTLESDPLILCLGLFFLFVLEGTGQRRGCSFLERQITHGALSIPHNICNHIAKAGGKCWDSLEGEQLSPGGQVDSGWELHHRFSGRMVHWSCPDTRLGGGPQPAEPGAVGRRDTHHVLANHQGEGMLDKAPWSPRQGLLSTTLSSNVNEKKNYSHHSSP